VNNWRNLILLLVCTEGEQMGKMMILLMYNEGEQMEECDDKSCVF